MKVTTNNMGSKVVEVIENNMVAIVSGNNVQINQRDPIHPEDDFKYSSVYMTKDEIIALAEKLKNI
jgi:hypothetical protein